MRPASLQKGLRSGWQSGASEPHLLTRRCFPMVRVLPFRASACRSAHQLHLPRIGCTHLHIDCTVPHIGCTFLRISSTFRASAISSTQTMDAFMHHVGAARRSSTSEQHVGAARRSALCATSHSAVLPARGYPSLFGSQCRLVANCQQRADATYGIFCKEVGAVVAASTTVTSSTVLAIISVQRRSCKTSGTV